MTPRDKLQARRLDQRFHKNLPKTTTKRIARLMNFNGRLRLLLGTADKSRTAFGRMYRLRIRLYIRFCTRTVTDR